MPSIWREITDFYSRKTSKIRCFHSVPSPGATVMYSSSCGLSRVAGESFRLHLQWQLISSE